jgi:RES domain
MRRASKGPNGQGYRSGGKRGGDVRLSDESVRPYAFVPSPSIASGDGRPWRTFGRIILNRHSDPLGFGKTPSRFSDPRRRIPSHRFGVIYLGETLKVCFLEAVLRDSRNGAVGDYPMDERELHIRRYVEIEIAAPLSLVDLRGDGAIRMGVPSDVARASSQRLGRV